MYFLTLKNISCFLQNSSLRLTHKLPKNTRNTRMFLLLFHYTRVLQGKMVQSLCLSVHDTLKLSTSSYGTNLGVRCCFCFYLYKSSSKQLMAVWELKFNTCLHLSVKKYFHILLEVFHIFFFFSFWSFIKIFVFRCLREIYLPNVPRWSP